MIPQNNVVAIEQTPRVKHGVSPNPTVTLTVMSRDMDYHQNLTVSSVAQAPPFHGIS